jgi:hypothetical protein
MRDTEAKNLNKAWEGLNKIAKERGETVTARTPGCG